MKKIWLAVLYTIFLISLKAEVRLPAVIGSNMVLQQNAGVKIWGWCDPGEKIIITPSWNNISDSTTGTRDAKWIINLKTPAAGGPYTIIIKGKNTITLSNIMLGEVWVCSGQSNMEYNSFYAGSKDIQPELKNPSNNNIHLFLITKATSHYPQDDCTGQWHVADSNSLKTFSEVAYFFAKKLNKNLNVPIGLIEASWGGTPAEVWTPAEAVDNNDALADAEHKQNASLWWPFLPGYTFNAMIAPVTQFNIAGVIWYQGESNTVAPDTYASLFTTMIKSWRMAWQENLPFYYVQIAPFTYGSKNSGAMIREQQEKALALENTGMVVTSDITADTNDIHPPDKTDVGNRLAGIALAEVYKQNSMDYKSPVYKSVTFEKNKAVIDFNYLDKELMIKGDRVSQLFIAGKDSAFFPADGKIENNKLVVSSKQVAEPVAVRYAFGNAAIGNLFNSEGLPVAPFRTDDWNVADKKIN